MINFAAEFLQSFSLSLSEVIGTACFLQDSAAMLCVDDIVLNFITGILEILSRQNVEIARLHFNDCATHTVSDLRHAHRGELSSKDLHNFFLFDVYYSGCGCFGLFFWLLDGSNLCSIFLIFLFQDTLNFLQVDEQNVNLVGSVHRNDRHVQTESSLAIDGGVDQVEAIGGSYDEQVLTERLEVEHGDEHGSRAIGSLCG